MKRFILIIGLLIFIGMKSQPQDFSGGSLVIVQDALIDSLLSDYETLRLKIMENPDSKAIQGYRIQIFFDSGLNSSDRAGAARDQFLLLYPDIPAYVNWKAPNYRVRIGDFRTRLEAEKILQLIIVDYPNAWVIKDEINFP